MKFFVTFLFSIQLLFINQPIFSRTNQNLLGENNGFFAGITQNQFQIKDGGIVQGHGWQAGIIQKTEKRGYGFLTGLLYFDYIKAEGQHPSAGNIVFSSSDIVFSLWLTQIWRENSSFAPMISAGPAFVFKINSEVETDNAVFKYTDVALDFKGQLAMGAYIKVNKGLYLLPQIFFGYNLYNNNKFSEIWDVRQEINYGIQFGLIYSTDY